MTSASLPSAQPPEALPRFLQRHGLRLVIVGLAYFLAHQIAFLFPDSEKVLAAVWPAGGIGLAALLLSPRPLWPALLVVLFVAGNTANLLAGRPLINSLGFMTANALESLACADFILRWCGPRMSFARVRDILALGCAATAVNGLTALVGAGTATLTTGVPFWSFYVTWWVADGLGIFLVAPLIVTFCTASWTDLRHVRRWVPEVSLFFVLWVATNELVFQPAHPENVFAVQPYMLLALLAWPALRFGSRGVTAALVLMAIIAVSSSAVSVGPLSWGGHDSVERLLLVQIYLAAAGLTSFLLAASYAETRAAEQAAREGQLRLRALGDNLPNGAVYEWGLTTDKQRKFLYVSSGIERLTGLSAETVLQDSQAFYALIDEEDRREMATVEAQAIQQAAVFHAVVRQRRLDGQVRWMELTSAPRHLPNGQTVWDGIQLDVTERQQAEVALRQTYDELEHRVQARTAELTAANAALRESQERYRILVETSPDGIVMTDLRGCLFMANAQAAALNGLADPAELIGRNAADFFAPEDQARAIADIRRTLDTGRICNGEYVMIRADDVRYQAELTFALVGDPQAQTQAVMGVMRDITERKQAEEKQSNLMAQLEQQALHRTQELTALYQVSEVAIAPQETAAPFAHVLATVLSLAPNATGTLHLLQPDARKSAEGRSWQLAAQQGLPPALVTWAQAAAPDKPWDLVFRRQGITLIPRLTDEFDLPGDETLAAPGSYLGIPLQLRSNRLGVLSLFRPGEVTFSADELALLSALTDQLGLVTESLLLRQRIKEATILEERQRLAGNLHDSVTQLLYSVVLFAGAGRNASRAGNDAEAMGYLNRMDVTALQALKEMRLLLYELRPAMFETLGLVETLAQRLDMVERRAQVSAELTVEGNAAELPIPIQQELYGLAQEALNNALKHARATRVAVHLQVTAGGLCLEVTDNGLGFVPDDMAHRGGLGLISMRERAQRVGGTLSILSAPGTGTHIRFTTEASPWTHSFES
jgi:PAS domain S-box-containing protein